MDIQALIKRYEKVDSEVTKIREDVQREKIEIEIGKEDLKHNMEALQASGVKFSNITELEGVLDDLVTKLEDVLTSTERKLSDSNI